MYRAGVVMIVAMLAACPIRAQQEEREEPRRETAPQFLFYEAVNLVSSDSVQARVDVHYRIDAAFFVAVRNADPSFPWPFKRRGEILVELIDSLETSQARDINRIEIGANSSEIGVGPKQWYQGIASFSVPPGPYKIVFDVDDLESERRYLNREVTTRVKRFGAAQFDASPGIFIYALDSSSAPGNLIAQNFGGNLLFGKKSALYFELPLLTETESTLQIEYTLSTSKARFADPEPVLTDTVRNPIVLRGVTPVVKSWNDSIGYELVPTPSASSYSVIAPLRIEQLPLRRYSMKMTIKQGSKETEIPKTLQMVWPDMPRSLRDVDYAIEALRFITRESQRDSLKRGTIEERRDVLEAFWKEKDKTPETAYNEMMAEYYRRVDYAAMTFGTLRDVDGLKADRGRIYVLHGPPTKIERTLDPSAGFRETWVYEKLNKKFVFVDKSKSGVYVLVATQTL